MSVNWKFWTWAKLRRELRELGEFHDELGKAALEKGNLRDECRAQQARLGELYDENAALKERLGRLYEREPAVVSEAAQKRANLERLMALAGVKDHPLWKVVLSYADEHARNEELVALGPNLTDADRHYNAGRAGGALDFAVALRDLALRAEAEAGRHKSG